MRYAITINLDYDCFQHEDCRHVWQSIRNRMVEAGFRIEGRLFTIHQSPEEACALARSVIANLEKELGQEIYSYLKEFFGNDHSSTVNLLLPPTETLQLDEG